MKIGTSLVPLLFAVIFPTLIFAQTTAFNFQGRLNDGTSPANGHYDLQFKLFDAITGGTQVGSTLDRTNLLLVNGVFSTSLDFGGGAFAAGNRFLEISVRPFNSPNAHVVLGARQQILSVPLAVRATTAGHADTATNATNATNAINAQAALSAASAATATHAENAKALGGVSATGYARLNVQNTGNVVAENLGSAGILAVQGNAIQPLPGNGFVKAMVEVKRSNGVYVISKCHNGVTGETANSCGFLVSSNIPGVIQVSFGFPVASRFVAAMPQVNSGVTSTDRNFGVNYNFPAANPNTIEFFTFENDEDDDTTPIFGLMVIVY